MGYRGEDAPRARADSRRRPPRQPSSGRGPAAASWDDGTQGYRHEDSYAGDGAHSGYDGYQPDDSYAGYDNYDQHAGDDQPDGHDGYSEPNGYGQDGDYGYPQRDGYGGSGAQPAMPGGYGRSGGYPTRAEGHSLPGGYPAQHDDYSGSGGYPAQHDDYSGSGGYPVQRDDYGRSGGYPAQPDEYSGSGGYPVQRDDYSGSGGYPAQGGGYGSGGYPVQPDDYSGSGGYPTQGGGYGSGGYPAQGNGAGPEDVPGRYAGNDWYGRPSGASGSGFADTGTYNLDARAIDAYGTGPRSAPPEIGAPPGLVHTGQQERYDDEYESYPGYEGQADDYGDAPGYPNPQGYGQGYDEPAGAGYDDPYEDAYGDHGPAGQPGSGGKAAKGGKGKKGNGGARFGRRKLLLSAVVVVIVGIAAAAGYVFVLKPKPAADSASTGPLPSPGSTSAATAACQKQLGQYCHIESRTDDPKPLTVAELFPPAFVNETDHGSFTLVGTKLDTTCSNAVIGQDLISSLQSAKCTQVVRASYVSGNDQIMGTIGVANLDSTNGAHDAGRLIGTNDFVAPLSTSKGIASKLGQGTGIVQSEYKGHYLIMIWAEFSNLKAPANNAQDAELQQFGSDLIAGTANISLSQRMVNGAPATAAS